MNTPIDFRHLWIEPHYFPSIPIFKKLYQASSITFDIHSNYQKQSYQNRCYIATSQGLQPLIVPIQHKTSHGYLKQVRIDYTTHWHKKHQHALQTAYGKTPYFTFLSDVLYPIILAKPTFLYQLSYKILETLLTFLQIQKRINLSSSCHATTSPNTLDLRHTFHPKKAPTIHGTIPDYTQRFGKIQKPQLSILDLLCMQGPYACQLFV